MSELKRYDTTKVEYPPARIVKLTMAADGAENEPGYTLVHSSLYTCMIDLGVYIYASVFTKKYGDTGYTTRAKHAGHDDATKVHPRLVRSGGTTRARFEGLPLR